MPHTVTGITSLYTTHLPRVDHAGEIEKYLPKMEKKGYQLHSVLPDHQVWKADENPSGKVETILISYKP